MISEDKVRYMTRLASFEEKDGRKYEPMKKYFASDYVAIEMLKSLVTGTIAFAVVVGLIVCCNLEDILENLSKIDYIGIGKEILVFYLAFMALYMVATYITYSVRYSRGRKKIKRFYAQLRRVEQITDEKISATQRW